MVKTVTLTADTPQKVTFDGAYPFYWIDNKSVSDVYASVGIPEANADGTYTVAAGSQMRISGGVGNDGITLLGEGKVQVVASAIAACPFKSAPAVGGGGDYSKPDGGIPKADLAADVQTSLNKAETALQEHQSLADYVKTTDSRLMSAEDKVKLDGIDDGANKTVVDTVLSGTSENPISNKAVNAALAKKAASSHTHDDRYYTKNALDTKLDELTSGNSACVCGIYTGDGVIPRTISLGFTPSAVLISSENGAMGATTSATKSGALAVGNSVGCTYNSASATKHTEMVGIVGGGFQLLSSNSNHSNGYTYHYVAFR